MSKAKELPVFPPANDFLLNAPLYDVYARPSGELLRKLFYTGKSKVDGHCPSCGRETTFTVSGPMTTWGIDSPPMYPPAVTMVCARSDVHVMRFWLRVDSASIQKIGQFPSLADVANDQSKAYRGVLSKDDAAEFHRAIGLAAHGIGIGAFVYLRRIFERLIHNRFVEFQGEEGWSDEDFGPRMSDKINLLKDHLPQFLVENQKIYGILSLGLHELSEEDCRNFFDVLKASIVMILEEDKVKRAELEKKVQLQKAIQQFTSNKPNAPLALSGPAAEEEEA